MRNTYTSIGSSTMRVEWKRKPWRAGRQTWKDGVENA